MKLRLSFGRRDIEQDASCKSVVVKDLAALSRWLKQSATPGGDSAWVVCPMGNGRRSKKNALPTRLLFFDFDKLQRNEPRLIRYALREMGVGAVSWPTRRSTPSAPRLRLIVQAGREIDPVEYPDVHANFVRQLRERTGSPAAVDKSSANPEQAQFVPKRGIPITHIEGEAFEVRVGLRAPIEKELRTLDFSMRNVDFTSVAGSLRRRGLDVAQIEAALTGLNDQLADPLPAKEIRTISRSIGERPTGESNDQSAGPSIHLRSALNIVAHPPEARWLHRPYLEQGVLAILWGDFGTYKTFLALDWALHLAAGKPWYGKAD